MANKQRVVRTITLGSGLDVPPILRSSIYPWEDLINSTEENPNFFVACSSQAEAVTLRGSVQQSGKAYFSNRKVAVAVVTRAMERGKTGSGDWGVYAWAPAVPSA